MKTRTNFVDLEPFYFREKSSKYVRLIMIYLKYSHEECMALDITSKSYKLHVSETKFIKWTEINKLSHEKIKLYFE